ncbi:hypothetical protein [Consotaella aegiceratis]|uniref:hypothetical protein n=1 Tax=Consotaella aegiceratis TaxID=3097961 RepID=UPI002F41CE93
MKVTNNAKGLQGIQTVKGMVFLRPGETKTVDMTESQAERARRLSFLALSGDPVSDADTEAEATSDDNPQTVEVLGHFSTVLQEQGAAIEALQQSISDLSGKIDALKANDGSATNEAPKAVPVYEVKQTSPGWYAIFEGETQLTKGLRQTDVEGFDAKTDAEKAAFVDANKAED